MDTLYFSLWAKWNFCLPCWVYLGLIEPITWLFVFTGRFPKCEGCYFFSCWCDASNGVLNMLIVIKGNNQNSTQLIVFQNVEVVFQSSLNFIIGFVANFIFQWSLKTTQLFILRSRLFCDHMLLALFNQYVKIYVFALISAAIPSVKFYLNSSADFDIYGCWVT